MREKWIAVITDENRRRRMQFVCVFLLLGCVAAVMAVLNLVTHRGVLASVTGAFSALCFLNFGIVQLGRGRNGGMTLVSFLFMLELLAMFTFFIISGNPDGFSCIWIALLPACGMLFFGRKRATVLCAAMLAILLFFFWTPTGRALLQYEYGKTFMLRFPLLFVAFFALFFLLETIRDATQRELDRLREKYKRRSAHDYLTDMLNRQGLEEWRSSAQVGDAQAVFMIDIDHFKNVNDSYGHDVGDLVLASVAQETARHVDTQVCRWGGEEFVVWFPDSRGMSDPETLRRCIEEMTVQVPNCDKVIRVTVSIGVAKGDLPLEALVRKADEAMYRAKAAGRNRVEYAD